MKIIISKANQEKREKEKEPTLGKKKGKLLKILQMLKVAREYYRQFQVIKFLSLIEAESTFIKKIQFLKLTQEKIEYLNDLIISK